MENLSANNSTGMEDVVFAGLSVRWWVFGALLLPFLIDLVSSVLNRAWLGKPIPEELGGIYDQKDYATAQRYNRKNSTIGFVETFFSMAGFQAFWWLEGFAVLDKQVVSLGWGSIASGLVYVFALGVGGEVMGLPFSIYNTFWLEAEFGFNNTTVRTFVKDRLKGLALMLVIGAPVLSTILWFFESAGSNAWLYVWIVMSVFSVIMMLIAPVYIMPLFIDMIPLPEGAVVRVLKVPGPEKENPNIFLKRIFYEVDAGHGGSKAFETKDHQCDGKKGEKLSLWCKDGVWCISEGDLKAEKPVVYAVSSGGTDPSPVSGQWKLKPDEGTQEILVEAGTGEGFKVVQCDVGKLRADLLELATRLNYTCNKIFLIDGSTRSEHSNAFCTGFGSSRRICLFDSMLGKLSGDEIVAVLGHEIGHDKLHHVKLGIVQSLVMSFIQFFFMGQFISNATLAHVFFLPAPKVYIGLLLFGVVWGTVDAFLGIPFTIQSRSHEYAADRYSIDAGEGNAELLASGLMKMMRNSKTNLTPHPMKVFLDFSHPPLLTRVQTIGQYKQQRWPGSTFTIPILSKDD